jgi:hypothetical protein
VFDEVKAGDLIAVSGKGLASNAIQIGSLSLPNVGSLGRWNWAGPSHVLIAAPIWGERTVYESTSFPRPPCVRSNRPNPKGVQAHFLKDIVDAGGNVWHYPLRSPLYLDEEDRLLQVLDSYIGRGYDFLGAGKSGGGYALRLIQRLIGSEDLSLVFCSELVVAAYVHVGIMQHKNAGAWNPARLVRHVLRQGICGPGHPLT